MIASARSDTWKYTIVDINHAIAEIARCRSVIVSECSHTAVLQACPMRMQMLCATFCTLVEVGLQHIWCFCTETRAQPFSKASASPEVRFPHGTRDGEAAAYNFFAGRKLPAKLVEMSRRWMPYKVPEGDGSGIWYTRFSFYLQAIRHVRNVGTHRSLRLFQVPATVAPGDALTAQMSVWLPYNPALAEYSMRDLHRVVHFQDTQPVCHRDNGFVAVPASVFLRELDAAAAVVQDDLCAVLDELRSAART